MFGKVSGECLGDFIEISKRFNPELYSFLSDIDKKREIITEKTKVMGWNCNTLTGTNICGIDYNKETDTLVINFTTDEE